MGTMMEWTVWVGGGRDGQDGDGAIHKEHDSSAFRCAHPAPPFVQTAQNIFGEKSHFCHSTSKSPRDSVCPIN